MKKSESEKEAECDESKYVIVRGFLHEVPGGKKPSQSAKKVILQVGKMLFDLNYWGEVKDGADLAKLLKDDRYAVKLLKGGD